ncbi:S8 family peptidase [Paenibacillus eucommiae]|uniref:Subtilisin family serine protease n=1 Tax=Paenibacillus eucommiae TaxID=1355755 RepID=A0ABS4IZA0_9BACL|nr:S8 family peptidase [Paenibacillus eucommiae]MBP1992919.1 subtilisin family serine protease [Paenibacillus eucommiae]
MHRLGRVEGKRKSKVLIVLWSLFLILSVIPLGGVEAAAPISPSKEVENSTIQGTLTDPEQRVVVVFKDKVDKSVIQKAKGKVKKDLKKLKAVSSISIPASEIEKLRSNPLVASVEPDIQLQITAQTMDWGVTVVNATYAWNNGYTGKGIKVAVLDSGIEMHHEDIMIAGGVSFVDYTQSYDDDFGHGTHVAGIIGAKNNNIGVVGVAPDADLYSVKVLDSHGVGYLSDVIAGIDWAVDNKMDIINMSMATSVDSPALHNVVDQAYASNVLIVASAGNAGNAEGTGETIQYPAKYSSVISVGAVDQNGQRATFSSTGSELEIVAPGVGINSTYLSSRYKVLSGTSMASAFVTGKLALLKQIYVDSTSEEMRLKLLHEVMGIDNNGKVPSSNSVTVSTYQDLSLSQLIYASSALNGNFIKSFKTFDWSMCNCAVDASGYTYKYSVDGVNVVNNSTIVPANAKWATLDGFKTFDWSMCSCAVSASGYTFKYSVDGVNVINNSPTVPANAKWATLDNFKTSDWSMCNCAVDASGYTYKYSVDGVNIVNNSPTVPANAKWATLDNFKTFDWSMCNCAVSASAYTFGNYAVNSSPTITINNSSSNQYVYNQLGNAIITITGIVNDVDNDPISISATIGGVTKSVIISNTKNSSNWSLQWNITSDPVSYGIYSNISISANDNWFISTASYNGSIVVDQVPNAPSALTPGSTSSSTPTIVAGTTPNLGWTFTDPDIGDTQSAYDVQIYNAAGNTLIYDSGWVNSTTSLYTVPLGKITRGTSYSWKVAVKDSKGGISAFSPLRYIKANSLPTLSLTSYANGQQLSDNVLTFTWTYADTNGQTQTSYRVQGSKDNWATIGYDSDVKTGAATTLQTTALPDGTWSFKVTVNDGMEWSSPATRNNLIIPNTYEPNDTSAQAFGINYNTSYTSSISSATDVDFFKYIAPVTGIDRITMTVPNGLNYDVYIYDSNNNQIASSTRGTGIAENVLFEVNAGNTYYIKVVGGSGSFSTTNPYALIVNKLSMQFQTNYQFDSNGNIIEKTTTKTN